MPRPKIPRRLFFEPGARYFKPQGIPLRNLKEVLLDKDEVEALKLIEIEGKTQEDAAAQMNISQPTFFRIIKSARQKIADAIINGKAIKIK